MTKVPRAGWVKTRLATEVGEKHAVGLYRCFLLDLITTLNRTSKAIIVYYTPENALVELQEIMGEKLQYALQIGEDLGERLYHGMEFAKELGYKYAVALATDVPDITIDYLIESANALDRHNVVIGPSTDGGYNLIGLNLEYNEMKFFSEIEWGTDQVYSQTIAKLNGLKVYVLPPWVDIDMVSDLENLRLDEKSQTYKYLMKNMGV